MDDSDEFNATIEACGKAAGYALGLILSGQVKTPADLSDALEAIAYDRPNSDPRTILAAQAMLEGLSVAVDGGPDASL